MVNKILPCGSPLAILADPLHWHIWQQIPQGFQLAFYVERVLAHKQPVLIFAPATHSKRLAATNPVNLCDRQIDSRVRMAANQSGYGRCGRRH